MNPDLQILFLFSNLAAEEPADHEQSHSSHPAAGNTDNNSLVHGSFRDTTKAETIATSEGIKNST
jgi:hypothetical protein